MQVWLKERYLHALKAAVFKTKLCLRAWEERNRGFTTPLGVSTTWNDFVASHLSLLCFETMKALKGPRRNAVIRVFIACHKCYWVFFKITTAKSISHQDRHSWNADINKTALCQQLQIHKWAMSHCDTKGQGSIEVIKILVDFVNLVVGGKASRKNNLGWGNRCIHITEYLACHIKM